MTDWATEVVACLRDTMLGIAPIATLVSTRIYWEDVEDTVELPYIVVAHLMGGYENTTQAKAVDSYWKICFYTADKATALAAKQAMADLHFRDLDVTNSPMVYPYAKITEETAIFERDVAQNVPVYEVGGHYRVRVIINEVC